MPSSSWRQVMDTLKTASYQGGEEKTRFRYLRCSFSGQRSPLQTSFGFHLRCIPGPLGRDSLGAQFFPEALSIWSHWKAEGKSRQKEWWEAGPTCTEPVVISALTLFMDTNRCSPKRLWEQWLRQQHTNACFLLVQLTLLVSNPLEPLVFLSSYSFRQLRTFGLL